MADNQNSNTNSPPRRKGLTSVTLGWLAERIRRADKIKQDLEKGVYKVDSGKVAASILNEE